MKNHTNYDSAEARKILGSDIPAALTAGGVRFDSDEAASVFFARELDYIKSETYDVEYPELTALSLFPISNDADPGANNIVYYTYDKSGLAKVVDNYSTDLPRVDVGGEEHSAKIKSIGASYGYSVQEMRASRLAGKSLDVRKAQSARQAVETAINKIAWAGDPKHGLLGILSTEQNIPFFTVTAKSGRTTWLEKTADEILDDINGMAKQVARTTKNVERPDTLCLPSEVYMHLSTKRIPDTSTTVLQFLLDNSVYIKNIISVAELDADAIGTNPYAALSGGQGVAFLFKNDKRKLSLEIPMPFYQYPVQIDNLETKIPCEARVAGVIMYYPMSALLAVGVSAS